MKPIVFAAALALVTTATPAAAQQAGDYYVAAKGLVGLANAYDVDAAGAATADLMDDTPEWIGGPGLAFGYRMKNLPVRLETEWLWRYRFDFDVDVSTGQNVKTDVGTHSLMWNAFYDFPAWHSYTFYLGAGLGVALSQTEANDSGAGQSDESAANFTWMASVGARRPITDFWTVDLSYRYSDLGEIETGTTPAGVITADSYTSHDVLIGIVYGF